MGKPDPRVVLDGLSFPEVPRWRSGGLWFSDFQIWLPGMTGTVMLLEAGGSVQTVVEQVPQGPPSGLGWLPDGRLLLAAARGRKLLALESDGSLTTYADLSGVTSHPCNDLVVDATGRAYVGSADPPPAPAGLSELIAVNPDGRAEVADSSMRYPNGMVITPDGGTLIVAESQGQCLTAFTIAAGGELSAKRVWAAIPGSAPDGICLDQDPVRDNQQLPHWHRLRPAAGQDTSLRGGRPRYRVALSGVGRCGAARRLSWPPSTTCPITCPGSVRRPYPARTVHRGTDRPWTGTNAS